MPPFPQVDKKSGNEAEIKRKEERRHSPPHLSGWPFAAWRKSLSPMKKPSGKEVHLEREESRILWQPDNQDGGQQVSC